MRPRIFFLSALFCTLLCGMATAIAAPQRLVIVVLDQMRPDYIDTYNLPHLKALRQAGMEFRNGHVGHFPSITVVSHPTIATGLFPRHFGWSDDILQDATGSWHEASVLSLNDYRTILARSLPRPTALRLLKNHLGGLVFSVGEKGYAAMTMGGLDADTVITMRKIKEGPWAGWCQPEGLNVPAYIARPEGGRFYVDCRPDYGTADTLYALDGNHYVPGDDPDHLGGDVWATDVALTLLTREPKWRVLLLTLGAIDKIGHIFGEMDNQKIQRTTRHRPYQLAKVLQIADAQVGRLIEHLKSAGLWEDTIFFLTADHGGISAAKHFYNDPPPKGRVTGVFGRFTEKDAFTPPTAAAPWLQRETVAHAVLGTANRIWLTDAARGNAGTHCKNFAQMPGAIDAYVKHATPSWHYERCTFPRRSTRLPYFLDPVSLLGTVASPTAPDLVVQLAEETGYGLPGDHGGFQEKSMRIPMLLHVAAVGAGTTECPMRLVDIMPTAMRLLGLQPPAWLDGNAACLTP
ncbi:MAG: alkaline phosphatase family protein [Deltaproteobacteria bacterium]|nr:alkaline phosphatase family protein [Deltaproteobacteria bacterium]